MASNSSCIGDGTCLDIICQNKYIPAFTCMFSCQPIKCLNYCICNAIRPLWTLNNDLCSDCDIIFEKELELMEATCLSCYETKLGINPMCDHFVCIECFKSRYSEPDVKMPILNDFTNKDVYFEELNKWDEARELKRLNKFLCLFCFI